MTTSTTAPAMLDLISGNKVAEALTSTIKSSVNGAGKYAAYVEEFDVTRETVKDHAAALAALTYPNDAPVQKKDGKRTRFGNAVQAAGNGLRNALTKPTPDNDDTVNFLTKDGVAALAEISDDDLAAVIHAEIERRNNA